MSESTKSKDSRLDLRVTLEQKELLERAAAIKGVSLSAYTLSHLLPAARQDIDSHEKLILSNRDRDLFMSVMENPPELKGKLKSVIEKYREKYEK
jgi:uncharacterized protein (DUF1778 family)